MYFISLEGVGEGGGEQTPMKWMVLLENERLLKLSRADKSYCFKETGWFA